MSSSELNIQARFHGQKSVCRLSVIQYLSAVSISTSEIPSYLQQDIKYV